MPFFSGSRYAGRRNKHFLTHVTPTKDSCFYTVDAVLTITDHYFEECTEFYLTIQSQRKSLLQEVGWFAHYQRGGLILASSLFPQSLYRIRFFFLFVFCMVDHANLAYCEVLLLFLWNLNWTYFTWKNSCKLIRSTWSHLAKIAGFDCKVIWFSWSAIDLSVHSSFSNQLANCVLLWTFKLMLWKMTV